MSDDYHGKTNPFFLDAIVKASDNYDIIASQDIVDVRGINLWSKGRKINATLQQRLLERKLAKPIESCLYVEDGFNKAVLKEKIDAFFLSQSALAIALNPWRAIVSEQVNGIHIHPLVQLLLTTAQVARPPMIEHAVAGMVLAGAMVEASQGSIIDIKNAMLAGLLHDIGEIYIQPNYLDKKGQLTLEEYKHLAVHPRIAQILLATSTDYPIDIARAIGEHHERLDGSGYPASHQASKISPLGRILAIVEVVLGISKIKSAPLMRASFALRFIPGEFDPKYIGFIFDLANAAAESIAIVDGSKNMNGLDEVISRQKEILDLEISFYDCESSAILNQIILIAKSRLLRLQVGCNSVGLWGIDFNELSILEKITIDMVNRESMQRLKEIERECLLLAEKVSPEERVMLSFLWKNININ